MGGQTETRRRHKTGSVESELHHASHSSVARAVRADVTMPHPTDLRVRLLDAVVLRPPIRRTELCRQLDVSLPVVAKEIAALQTAGLLVQSSEDPAQRALGARGRPPVYVSVMARAAHAIGIEVGTRTMRAIVCDLSGAVRAARALAWFPVDPQVTVERVREVALRVLDDADIALEDVVGVGVSAASALTGDQPTTRTFAAWDGVDPAAAVQSRLGIATTLERAAIAGALAEQRLGAAAGVCNVMYVRLSTGCGVGFIVRGKPHRGVSGLAGEVGHVPMTAGRRRCYCGRHGCLETVANSEAVAGLFADVYGERVTAPHLLELVQGGDDRARRLVADVGSVIGTALAPAVNLMNPEVCIIGGELSLAGEPLVAAIRRSIERGVGPAIAGAMSVVTSQTGQEAEALGAAIMQILRSPALLARRSSATA